MSRIVVILGAILLLSLQPCSSQQQGIYTGPSRTLPAGAASDGFAISLGPASLVARLGDPIRLYVELRNVSGKLQYAYLRSRNRSYDFEVVKDNGTLVSRNDASGFGLDAFSGPSQGRPVPAGDSIFGEFRLDELYNFAQPGDYSVRVSQARPNINGQIVTLRPSNSIRLIIKPR